MKSVYAEHRRFPLHAGALMLEQSALHRLWINDLDSFGDPVPLRMEGSVAVLSIIGPLAQRAGYFWTGYDVITARFVDALQRDEVGAVLLEIDSPGGVAAGVFESVRAMRQAKEFANKPVVAVANERAYSAAYALASVADHIVVPDAGGVGSIGVIRAVYDLSRMNERLGINATVLTSGARKSDGHPDVPLSSDARTRMQAEVDALAELFVREVAASRGLTQKTIRELEAATFLGAKAVDAGLADQTGNVRDAIALAASLAKPTQENRSMKSVFRALGLSDDATEASVLSALTLMQQRERLVCAALGVSDSEEATKVIHSLKAEAIRAQELSARIEKSEADAVAAEKARAAKERAAVLDQARDEGRITPFERAEFDTDPEIATLSAAAIKRLLAKNEKKVPLREKHEQPTTSGAATNPSLTVLIARAEQQGFEALTPDEKARLYREARGVHDALRGGSPLR